MGLITRFKVGLPIHQLRKGSGSISRILYLCSDLSNATNPKSRRAGSLSSYLVLLLVGFTPSRLTTDSRELLPHDFTLATPYDQG